MPTKDSAAALSPVDGTPTNGTPAKSNFTVHVMNEADIEDCMNFFSESFEGEPITSEVGLAWTVYDWRNFWRLYIPGMAKEGNTHIIRNENGEVVSGFTAMDFSSKIPDGVDEFIKGAQGAVLPFFEVLSDLEHMFIDHMKMDPAAKKDPSITPKGEIFYLFGLATHKEYRNRGLASLVTQATLDHARSRGYKCAISELSGNWSQKILSHHGKVLFELDYKTWEKDGKKWLSCVPETYGVDKITLVMVEF